MHYFPISFPFLLILFLLFIFLLFMIEVGVLSYAYQSMGIHRRYVFSLLLLSLLGSYVNIPLFQLPPEQMVTHGYVDFFGMRHTIPMLTGSPGTIIAVNLGGAVVPFFLSLYLASRNHLYGRALVGIFIVTIAVHMMAHPIRGVGIAVPVFIPPFIATIAALLLSREYAPALAYISGTIGTLLGADLLNLDKIRGLGAPVASIGGAGTFDGIFSTGILAVLLAGLLAGKRKSV